MNPTRPLAAILAAVMLVASAPPPRQIVTTAPPNTAVPADCPLSVGFASYGTGINRVALRKVEALLRADARVTAIQRYPWGREGEVTLCAKTRGSADAARLFRRIKSRLPSGPTPPITVATRSGLSFQTADSLPR